MFSIVTITTESISYTLVLFLLSGEFKVTKKSELTRIHLLHCWGATGAKIYQIPLVSNSKYFTVSKISRKVYEFPRDLPIICPKSGVTDFEFSDFEFIILFFGKVCTIFFLILLTSRDIIFARVSASSLRSSSATYCGVNKIVEASEAFSSFPPLHLLVKYGRISGGSES